MGTHFPVYAPEHLSKLDPQKRAELKAAIQHVLKSDPEVKQMLRDKTKDKFHALTKSK
jgi:hypothetical protein